jgi:hypothetical protein
MKDKIMFSKTEKKLTKKSLGILNKTSSPLSQKIPKICLYKY